MRRYLRAFIIALKMTLRGETPPVSHRARLTDWMRQGIERLDLIERLAAQHQIDPQAVVLHIDRRAITMSTILRTARFHLNREYPILLRQLSDQSVTLLYASNMDDHFRLTRLEAAPELAHTPVRQAVAALAAHFEEIPKN